ncbi:MAG TPA: DNA polymerase/3'-5' exonuclease PolX [Phycisphaerae bacterium]|nr:DNA polymerase/3'-5' exonuclease PolX [Phycisphaerae bacterium]
MDNARIAAVFDRIADILEILGENAFRIRSYRNASRTVGDMAEPLADMVAEGEDLTRLPGIGEGLAGRIHEILESGTCEMLEDLRQRLPPKLTDLLHVKGLGPKKVKVLYERLGIETLADLKAAAEAGRIRDLEGMGAKTEQNILKGLATLDSEAGRISIKEAADAVRALARHLEAVGAIRRWDIAGSCRRRRETIGDLDVLVEASDRERAADGILAYPPIEDVVARGEQKVSVALAGGLQVDFRFIEAEAFGAAMMYFTGSKAHNITLRKRAQKQRLKLNEYGLFRGKRQVAGKTEEEVFKALDLPWIPPELREDRGEIDAASEGNLPKLIEQKEIRGDLHAHTTATDGANTPQELAEAARARGYQYLAITDHSKAVTVAGGLDAEAVRREADRIRRLDADLKGFWLLAGIEVDILKDGRLDLPEKVLADLDWVVASVHSAFSLPEDKMTERLLAAVGSGAVHALGHPFGRIIGRRDPLRFDVDRVFEACRQAGVCLEINSYPDRLDLPDVYCKRAKEIGVTMVVSTDSHKIADLDLMEYGVAVARRGWLEKADVLNTLSASSLRKRLARR